MSVDLSQTSRRGYRPGRSYTYRALWLLVEALVMLNPVVTPYCLKRWVLRGFGARIGRGVIIKPNVHVKYPWRLEIGDNAWIGERAWIDNFVRVRIGANAVVSQGAYLCTGNHDWSDPGMGLVVKPLTIEDGAWVGAFAKIAPGVTVGREAVVTLGSVLLGEAEPRGIYSGNPAVWVRERIIRDRTGPDGEWPRSRAARPCRLVRREVRLANWETVLPLGAGHRETQQTALSNGSSRPRIRHIGQSQPDS